MFDANNFTFLILLSIVFVRGAPLCDCQVLNQTTFDSATVPPWLQATQFRQAYAGSSFSASQGAYLVNNGRLVSSYTISPAPLDENSGYAVEVVAKFAMQYIQVIGFGDARDTFDANSTNYVGLGLPWQTARKQRRH